MVANLHHQVGFPITGVNPVSRRNTALLSALKGGGFRCSSNMTREATETYSSADGVRRHKRMRFQITQNTRSVQWLFVHTTIAPNTLESEKLKPRNLSAQSASHLATTILFVCSKIVSEAFQDYFVTRGATIEWIYFAP